MARTCLHEARLVASLSPRIAAREAYLAMLHAAHARIAADGRKVPGTHKGVSIVIGELYRSSGYAAQAALAEVEHWKLAADYGRSAAASVGEAEAAIGRAEEFIARVTKDIPASMLLQEVDPDDLAALRAMDGPSRS